MLSGKGRIICQTELSFGLLIALKNDDMKYVFDIVQKKND